MEYSYQKINPQEVASFFLNEALLYYKKDDKFSFLASINLAGVAEELLGKLLIKSGRKNEVSFEDEKKSLKAVIKILRKENRSDKQLSELIYGSKNNIKHHVEEHYLDPKSEAEGTLERAIKNHEKYFSEVTSEMADFLNYKDEERKRLVRRVSEYSATSGH